MARRSFLDGFEDDLAGGRNRRSVSATAQITTPREGESAENLAPTQTVNLRAPTMEMAGGESRCEHVDPQAVGFLTGPGVLPLRLVGDEPPALAKSPPECGEPLLDQRTLLTDAGSSQPEVVASFRRDDEAIGRTLAEGVAENLHRVLSSRIGYGSCRVDLGLGEHGAFIGSPNDAIVFQREVLTQVERFEPRLEAACVDELGLDPTLGVRFTLQGRVGGEMRCFAVTIDSVRGGARVAVRRR